MTKTRKTAISIKDSIRGIERLTSAYIRSTTALTIEIKRSSKHEEYHKIKNEQEIREKHTSKKD